MLPTIATDYKHLKIDASKYVPESASTPHHIATKCLEILHLPYRADIKKEEKLLYLYNEECCRIAPFFMVLPNAQKLLLIGQAHSKELQ